MVALQEDLDLLLEDEKKMIVALVDFKKKEKMSTFPLEDGEVTMIAVHLKDQEKPLQKDELIANLQIVGPEPGKDLHPARILALHTPLTPADLNVVLENAN